LVAKNGGRLGDLSPGLSENSPLVREDSSD
jgi:hypothetical protein